MNIAILINSCSHIVVCAALTFAFASFALADERTLVTGGGPYRQVMLAETDLTKSASMVLDPSTGGGDLLHVRAFSADISYSLVLPTGVVVSASNAASYGFIWQRTEVPLDPAPGEYTGLAIVAPGWNDLITFPPSQPAGTYELQIARPVGGLALGVSSTFYSRSGVRLGVTTKQERPEPGQSPTVVAVLTDGALPISGATVQGKAHPVVPISSGVSVGNWQKQLKTDLGEGRSLYVYSADLANSASPYSSFRVQVKSPDPDVFITDDTVWFRDAASGETRPCTLCLELTAPTSPEPDTSSFAVAVAAEAPEIPFVLVDSTPEYPTSGDGVYSGTFPANLAGEYWLDVEASGSSQSQRPFARQAGMQLQVASVPASLVSFSDAVVETDGDSLPDGIRITATIHVNEPGEYYFGIDVAEPGTRGVDATGIAELPAGTQQMSVLLHRQSILRRFQSDGPYELRRAILKLNSGARRNSVADSRENAGVTGAYPLSTWKQGRLHLVGQAQLQAVDTDAATGFEFLRLSFRASVPTADACGWSVTLTDSQDNEIQRLTNSVEVAAGEHDFVVDFNGPRIVQSGLDGPYRASGFRLSCGYSEISEPTLATSAELTASAFTSGVVDFEVVLPSLGLARSEARMFLVQIAGRNGFDEMVDLTLLGLPTGVTGTIGSPISIRGGGWLELTADANASLGDQSITIQGTAGTIVRTFVVPIRVMAAAPEVTVSPQANNFLHPGMTRQFSATVQNAANQTVQWRIEPPGAASVSPEGVVSVPGTITQRSSAGVVATSTEDASRVGYADILLLPPATIALTPEVSSLRAGQETWVNAVLANNGNTYDPTLAWSVTPYPSPGGWTVPHPLRLYYRAPTTIPEPGTVTVTATFAEDPSALGTTTLTLIPDIQVSVSPTSATLRPGEVQSFLATVLHDPSNAGVSYTLSPQVGLIEANGLYSAPAAIAAPVNVTLTATSVADPARSATATIALLPAPNPRVTLAAPVTSLSIPAASSGTLLVNLTRVDGYAGEFTLSAAGLPAGVTATFFPKAASPASPAVLQLATGAGVATGAYPFTVVATADGETDSLAMTLHVIAMPEFTVTALENVVATPPGSTVEIPLQVVYRTGWSSILVWNVAGLPPGATIAYDPPSHWATGAMRATVTTTAATPAGHYVVQIIGKHYYDDANRRTVHVVLQVDPESVPDPWLHSGIGAAAGVARHVDGRYTLSGAGERVGSTQDAAQFVYQKVSGNFTLLTRVEAQSAAQGTAMAGLMVRESLAANARSFFVGWEGSTGRVVTMQRTSAGAESLRQEGPPYAMPYWLKLVREANVFRAYASYDQVRWRAMGQAVTMAIPTASLAGMAVASDSAAANTASFDRPKVTTVAGFAVVPAGSAERSMLVTEDEVEIPVSVSGMQGATGPYEFFVEDLPAGLEAAFFPAQMAGEGASALRLRRLTAPAGEFEFHVAARMGSVTERAKLRLRVLASPEPGALATGWLAESVGAPGAPGQTATASGGTTTVAASLAAIDGSFDRQAMAYQPMLGGASIQARLQTLSSGSALGQAGLAVRESLAPDAAFVAIGVKPDGTMVARHRSTAGETAQETSLGTGVLPQWLRLERKPGGVQPLLSTDGAIWAPAGALIPVALPELGYLGAFGAAGATESAVTASFGTVGVTRPAPEFDVRVVPLSRTVPVGQGLHYFTVQVLALYGFDGMVNLSAEGVPAGMQAAFYPAVVRGGETAVLRLEADATLSAGSYSIAVRGTNESVVKQTTVPLNVVATGSPTPLPWAVERFGGTQSAAPGINGATFTLTDSGFGPSGTTDNFQYTYRLTEGDLTMSAKITAMAWAWWGEPNACLMVRQSLAADSPFAAACFKVSPVTNSVEAEFRTRPRPGYPVSIVKGLTVAMPYWFRLDRRGNAYTARISSDGQKWTTVAASAEVAMPTVAFAGVGYGSGHATGSLSTTLQEVGVHAQPGAGADFLLAASPSDFYVAKNRRAYYSVDLDRLNGFAGEVQLAVAGVPAGVTLTATNPQTAIGGLLQFDVDATAVAGSYPLVVTGTHEGTTRQQTVRLHIADAVATALPGPWAGTYLGAQSASANSTFANGVFSVAGQGCCVSGTEDRAQFTFQPVQGNTTIVARLTTAGSFYSTVEKAGILLRSDLGPTSPFVFLGIVNNASAVLQVRERETLAVETKATVGSRPAPRWLKLERSGTEIRAYLSADGVAWEAVGQPYTFASLPERVFVGPVASPELSWVAWTVDFEGVSVVGPE